MKLIKTIKLHRKLRINQEVYCHRVATWSQDILKIGKKCPDLKNLSVHNRAVKKVEKKLPKLYFIFSDLFFLGGFYKKVQHHIINDYIIN